MVRTNYLNNVKREDVCANIREFSPVLNFSNSYLSEYWTLEVTINNKKGYVIALYSSTSQTSVKFDSFINNFKKILIFITGRDPHSIIW